MEKELKILFLRGYFFPENAASNKMCLDFVEALGLNGFKVNVVCPLPCRGVSNELRKEYKKKKHENINNNVTIRRFWLFKEKKNLVLRAFRYFLQNIFQFFYALFHKYDILFLYSTPPTNGIIGSILKILKHKPFIYNLHDVFPDSMLNMGMITKKSIIFKIGKKMEKFTYNHADKIITISDSIKENLISKGVESDKIKVVYNWVNLDEFKYHQNNQIIDRYKINKDKFIVTYAGNIGEAQGVDILINTAYELKDNAHILFVIIGNGAKEKQCKEFVKEKGMNNVIFLPMQERDKLYDVYSLGNVSLVSCKKGFGSCGMPSKTGSIMAAKTAVLASFDLNSELCKIIDKNNLGLCVEAGNSSELANVILELSKNPIKCHEFGENGYNYLLNNMTKEICTKKLVDIIIECYIEESKESRKGK